MSARLIYIFTHSFFIKGYQAKSRLFSREIAPPWLGRPMGMFEFIVRTDTLKSLNTSSKQQVIMKLLWLLIKWTVKSIDNAFTLKLSWTSQLPIALGKSFINREPFHLFFLPTPLHPKAGLQMKCLIYLSVDLLQSSWFTEKKRIYQPRPFLWAHPPFCFQTTRAITSGLLFTVKNEELAMLFSFPQPHWLSNCYMLTHIC